MHPLTQLVLQKGVENVSIPENLRFSVFTHAGTFFLNNNRYKEAATAFARAGNIVELQNTAAWLSKQEKQKEAAYFYQYTGDRDKISLCAHACLGKEHYPEAKMLFTLLNDAAMLLFLHENFNV